MTSFTIITPTYNRNNDILKRCIDCIESQTYTNWRHLVIIDDNDLTKHISQDIINKYSSTKREFITLEKNFNNFGNTPRQYGISLSNEENIVFVDDDNVIFPNFLFTFNKFIELNKNIDSWICKIIHLGPLPSQFIEPAILNGSPPILQNIDTLQFCVKTSIIKTYGWLDKGYLADGYTIENICKNSSFEFIDEILGVHM